MAKRLDTYVGIFHFLGPFFDHPALTAHTQKCKILRSGRFIEFMLKKEVEIEAKYRDSMSVRS